MSGKPQTTIHELKEIERDGLALLKSLALARLLHDARAFHDLHGKLERAREALSKTHYLCERCGGFGEQPDGVFNSARGKYDAKAGECELCNGVGYLGPKPTREHAAMERK